MAVCLGGTSSSRPLEELLRRTPSIAINPSGRHWNPWGSVTWTVNASLSSLVARLAEHPPLDKDPGWKPSWLESDRRAREVLSAFCSDGLWEGSIAHHLVNALPAGTLFRIASSMPIRDVDSFSVDSGRTLRVSSNRGVNGIDGTIACAVGQARCSGRPTTVMLGDLAFLHDQASLALVGAAKLRIVVLDNGGGAIFEHLPIAGQAEVFRRYFLTPQDADIGAIARAHGLAVDRIGTVTELESALEKPGPRVLHVVIDRGQDFAMHQAYWSSVRGE